MLKIDCNEIMNELEIRNVEKFYWYSGVSGWRKPSSVEALFGWENIKIRFEERVGGVKMDRELWKVRRLRMGLAE